MNCSSNKIKYLASSALLMTALFAMTHAFAQEDIIRKRIESHVAPGKQVQSVKKTPYSGLYEVRIGNRIIYTDSKANYIFLGSIIDIETGTDFTKERENEISKIRFSDLPLELAIKKVNGKGERTIAVFSDPQCSYCKQLEKMLQDIDNLTIYTFPLNILSQKSAVISKNIWCSPNRAKAWSDWMTKNISPSPADTNCSYSDETVKQLARKFDVSGTPVIFFSNGSRITGMPPIEELEKALALSK